MLNHIDFQKRCRDCKQTKSLFEFPSLSNRGRATYRACCRACFNTRAEVIWKRRKQKGLCLNCGLPARDGLTQCQGCADKATGKAVLHRRAMKQKCVEYLGGKCQDCGLRSEHFAIYDFHHTNPEEKDFGVNKLFGFRWARIVAELDKCILLCANCHRMRHSGEGV